MINLSRHPGAKDVWQQLHDAKSLLLSFADDSEGSETNSQLDQINFNTRNKMPCSRFHFSMAKAAVWLIK